MGESVVILFKTAEIPYVGVTVFWRFYENEYVWLQNRMEVKQTVSRATEKNQETKRNNER